MTTQYSDCGNYKFENGSLYSIGDLGTWFHVGTFPLCESVDDAIDEYFNREA